MRRISVAAGWLLWVVNVSSTSGQVPPRAYLLFDGTASYVEVPDSPDFSVGSAGALTVSAWMRPDTLMFPHTEGSGYVHWLGKGEGSQQEWVFRMYSQGNSENRANRISFYVFNPSGGLGIGSFFQDPVTPGQWIHVVGVADGRSVHIYKNGVLRDSDLYAGTITPQHGTAPMRFGTRDFQSFFQGAISQIRIWNRALSAAEINGLYSSGVVPEQGLVAQYLFEEGAGNVARDTKDSHEALVSGARWVCEPSASRLCHHPRAIPFR